MFRIKHFYQRLGCDGLPPLPEAYQEIAERFQGAFDHAAIGMALVAPDGRWLQANRSLCQITGYTEEELLEKTFQDITHPDDLDADLHFVQELLAGKKSSYQMEKRYLRKDGSIIWVLLAVSLVHDGSGKPFYFVFQIQDITERKRAESRYEATVEATGQVLYDWNTTTNEISWEGNCEGVFGFTREEMPRDLWGCLDLIHPADRDRFRQEIREVNETGRPFMLEYKALRKDGRCIVIEDRGQFVKLPGEKATHMVGILLDMTERRRLEEQLRQSQKLEAIGHLAGGIAHDFNNLLTIISSCSDFLLRGPRPEEETRQLLTEIQQASERSASLTRQLLAFSRKQVLAPTVLDLNEVVREMDKMVARLLGFGVRLVAQLDPALGAVRADMSQMEQVIVNLVINARDAMPEGGIIKIETKNEGQQVLLAVKDTGVGIAEEVRPHIFEPFFSTKGEKGTGLGLSVVHGIVQQSGGHIEVHSETGRGTTFQINLPRIG